MKLNKKGYLVVELVVSFVIAMTMAFMLLELATKIMTKNEDEYKDIKLETDKALMTNGIMDGLKDQNITSVSCSGKTLNIETKEGTKVLEIVGKELSYDGNVYKKTIDSSVQISDFECTSSSDGSLVVAKISMKTRYSDNDYGLVLFLPIAK